MHSQYDCNVRFIDKIIDNAANENGNEKYDIES